MLDVGARKLTRITGAAASAMFVDRLNDVLYFARPDTGRITRLYGGAGRRTGVWKSGRNPMAQHATLAWAQVEGDVSEQTPLLLRLYGDGYFIDYCGRVYERAGTQWRRRSDGALFTPGDAAFEAIHYTVKVTNSLPYRMPFGRWRDHEIEIESRARVTRVTLAGGTEELKAI